MAGNKNLAEDPYGRLANAIILQAVKDYRDAEMPQAKSAIIRFFRSEWFKTLTNLDPEVLIDNLKKEDKIHGR